ncbi:hypothetical protein Vafri_7094 [Volvox africanus]|uniref:Uncharacterized protein n=1 Tax=Volvox africanus TaxID=51714 RepID=A0A8J4B1S1_9CHLO|nr:hypothetical protein Vafri_7094 [Volvox africanus]
MWGQLNNLTKLVSEQAGSVIKEAGLDATLNSAKQQLTGQLDKLASSVLVIEPGQPVKAAGGVSGIGDDGTTNVANGQESASLSQLRDENAKLQLQARKLQETAADVLGELEEAQDALAREQAARATAEQRLEAVQKELERQLQGAASQSASSEEVQKLKDALASSEATAKAFEMKGRRQYSQLITTKQQLTELEASHLRMQELHAALEQRHRELQEELEALRNREPELHADRRRFDGAGGESPSVALSSQVEELRSQLQRRDEQLHQLQIDLEQQRRQDASAREAQAEAEGKARAQAEEAKAEAARLRTQLDAALANVQEAELRSQQASAESTRLATELQAQRRLKDQLVEAACAALSEQLAASRQQVEVLLADASESRAEFTQQQQALQEREVMLELERRRAADSEFGRADAEDRAAAAGAELERCKQRLAADEARYRREMDELNDSLDELRRQADEQGRAAASSTGLTQRLAVYVGQLESAAALCEATTLTPYTSYDQLLTELQERLAAIQGQGGKAGVAASPATAALSPCPAQEALQQELSCLRSELAQLRHSAEAVTHLRKQLAARDSELYDTRQALQRAEQERTSLEERLQRLQGQLREAREARDACGAESEDQRRRLQADLDAAGQRARELEAQLAAASAATTAAEHCAAAAVQRAADMEARAATAAAAAENTASVVEALTAQAGAAEAQVRQLRGEVDSAAASLATAGADAEAQYSQLLQEKSRLQQELTHAVSELQAAQARMEALERERADMDAEVTRVTSELEEAHMRAGSLDGERLKSEEVCRTLNSRLAAMEAEAVELRRQLGEGGEASKMAASALAAAQNEATQLKARLKEVEQQRSNGAQALQASERALAQAKSELQDTRSELAGARSQLAAAEGKIERLNCEVTDRMSALEAIRTGSQAEVALAAQRLSTATSRVAELEAALALATTQHDQATTALQHKLTAMEKEAASARAATRQLEQQVSVLRDSLTAERDAAAATAALVRSELEAKTAAEVSAATAALSKQWQARLDDAIARHSAALQETQQELETVRQRAQVAEEELAMLQAASGDMERLRKKVADFGPLTARLEADKAAACKAVAEAQAAQQQLEDRVRAMETEAAERNRKFQMLQRSFKGEVESARQQLEAVQAQIASHVTAAATAEQRAEEAMARCQAAEVERLELQQQLEDAHAAVTRLEASLAAQVAVGVDAAGKLAAVEAMLAEERAGQAAAQSDGDSLRQDFERLVAAAVAAREEEAERRVAAAVAREQSALAEARQAEARAEAAELAKIELTLALARVDDAGRSTVAAGPIGLRPSVSSLGHVANLVGTSSDEYFSGSSNHGTAADGDATSATDVAPSSKGSAHDRRLAARQAEILAEMQQRVDEAELAAAVQTRRAVGLEAEVATLQQQLSECQRQVKELSWQICVAVGDTPVTSGGRGPRGGGGAGSGGAASGSGGAASRMGMFDILGCGANYRRN